MDFRLPELGEGVYEAELVEWHVAPGDAVSSGQTLAEVMTDKATMELPAPFAGVIDSVAVESGEMMNVGDVVLCYSPADRVDAADADGESEETSAATTPAGQSQPNERTAESDGNGAERPGQSIVVAEPSPTPQSPSEEHAPPSQGITAAPSVRRMARSMGIDLKLIDGTGPGGRVLIDDLTRFVNQRAADEIETRKPKLRSVAAFPELDLGVPGTRMRLQGVRRQTADQMVVSKRTIPHYTYVDDCDVTELVRLRTSLRDSFSQSGLKLTYLPFIVKACVEALKRVPIVNASVSDDDGEIIVHDRYNVGIAVASARGLFVPVIRDADRRSIPDLTAEISRLATGVRHGRLKREEFQGGTFTVSLIGNIGGLIYTPVINHPEAAILAVGRIVKRPVYDDHDNLKPVQVMYLSFSFDHRIVDGAVGAIFANAVIDQLQHPATLLVGDDLQRTGAKLRR